jgi:hypothetical protein
MAKQRRSLAALDKLRAQLLELYGEDADMSYRLLMFVGLLAGDGAGKAREAAAPGAGAGEDARQAAGGGGKAKGLREGLQQGVGRMKRLLRNNSPNAGALGSGPGSSDAGSSAASTTRLPPSGPSAGSTGKRVIPGLPANSLPALARVPYRANSVVLWLATKEGGGNPTAIIDPRLCYEEHELVPQAGAGGVGVHRGALPAPEDTLHLALCTLVCSECASRQLQRR